MKPHSASLFLACVLLAGGDLRAQTARPDSAAASAAARAVSLEEVETPPALANRAEAARALFELYPPALRDAGVSGTVMVRFVVDEQGGPAAARVETSSGHAELDTAALRVLAAMRFEPARRGGAPVAVWVTLPLTFQPPPPADADSAENRVAVRVEEMPRLINVSEVSRLISRNFPEALRSMGREGSVIIRMRVDENGRPGEPEIARSSGHVEFDAVARRVARAMRFRPARAGGRAVKAWVVLPVNFELRP